MKGVIFNLLESFISEGWGADVYEEIFSACPLHTKEPFVGPGTYPDADLLAIVAKTCERLGVSPADALHAFGKFCFPKLAARVPQLLAGHTHPKTFLKSIDNVIHVEVKKLFKDAVTPRITYVDPGPGKIVLRYESRRQVCALMTGLLAGSGDYFSTPLSWHETQCTHTGADACEFLVEFERLEPAA